MITFACPSCARSYTVKEELAGKKVRCKHCNATMEIPEADIPLAPSSAFDDLPGPATPPPARPDDDDEPLPPPRRPGKTSSSSSNRKGPKKGGGEPFATPEQIRRMGVGFVILGVGTIVLPMFGLQFRRGQNLPPGAAIPLGLGTAALGGVLLAISVAMGRSREGSTFRLLGKFALFGCLGVVGLVGLVVILAIILPAIAGNRGGDPVAQAPPIPPSAFTPAIPPAATPPAEPDPAMADPGFPTDGPFPTSFPNNRPPGPGPGPGTVPPGPPGPPPGVPGPPGFGPGA